MADELEKTLEVNEEDVDTDPDQWEASIEGLDSASEE